MGDDFVFVAEIPLPLAYIMAWLAVFVLLPHWIWLVRPGLGKLCTLYPQDFRYEVGTYLHTYYLEVYNHVSDYTPVLFCE
ncbi:hypothetical protein BDV06DRAFT_81240 [Aspergillus oleicola]